MQGGGGEGGRPRLNKSGELAETHGVGEVNGQLWERSGLKDAGVKVNSVKHKGNWDTG